jgi:hypothetical protein
MTPPLLFADGRVGCIALAVAEANDDEPEVVSTASDEEPALAAMGQDRPDSRLETGTVACSALVGPPPLDVAPGSVPVAFGGGGPTG